MKRLTLNITLIFLFLGLAAQSENEIEFLIDNFSNIKDMPYICRKIDNDFSIGCGDSIFWKAVSKRDMIIPFLLERLDDTTTSLTSVPNFGGEYLIGDISLMILQVLIWGIPVLDLAEDKENPEPRNGYWGYWNYTRREPDNRVKFKKRIIDWYNQNKKDFVWIESDDIKICDCALLKNPAGGHYEIKK